MSSAKAMVFTDNHDNQRGHGAGGTNILTDKDGGLYTLANVFMLGWPYEREESNPANGVQWQPGGNTLLTTPASGSASTLGGF